VAQAHDVAAARRRELLDETPEPGVGGCSLGLACRGELRLVLPQALPHTPAADLDVATELLHVRGTRVLGARFADPDDSCGDDR
jgi:hypothetical protein